MERPIPVDNVADEIPVDAAAPGAGLLFDLDLRQNQILSDLDRLNDDVVAAINEWTRSDLGFGLVT